MCWQRDELLCLFLLKCDLVCGSHTRQPGRHCSSTEETPLFISNHTSVSLGKAKLRLFFPTEFPRWPSQTGAVTHRATGRERCGWVVCSQNRKEASVTQPSSSGEQILTVEFGKTKMAIKPWDWKTPHCCLSVRRRYMKHKRDDGAEKQDEETVDVTPIMICVFVVMCCSMLVLLYFFYDILGTADALAQHSFQHTATLFNANAASSWSDPVSLTWKCLDVIFFFNSKCIHFFNRNGLWVYLSCYSCVTWWRNSKMLCLGFSLCIKVVTARAKNNPLLGVMYSCWPQQLKIWQCFFCPLNSSNVFSI